MLETFTMQQLNELCSSPILHKNIIESLENALQPVSSMRPGSWMRMTPHKTTEFTLGDIAMSGARQGAETGRNNSMKCLALLPLRWQVMTIMPAVKRAAEHITEERLHDCIASLDKWLDYDRSSALVNPKMAEDDNIAYWPAYWALSAAAIVNACEYNPKVSHNSVTHIVASAADAASEAALQAAATYGTDNNARVAEMNLQLADILKRHDPIHLKENANNF